MKLILTAPLRIKTASGQQLDLLPVPMAYGFPSGTRAPWKSLWHRFVKAGGKRLVCDGVDILRVQVYMGLHGTEALSEDGEIAFTVEGNALVECLPAVCDEVEEHNQCSDEASANASAAAVLTGMKV